MKFKIVIPEWLSRERKAYLYDTFGNPPMIEAESVEAARTALKHAAEIMNWTIGYSMSEAMDNLLKDKEESDNIFRNISRKAKLNDTDKCMGNKQPICQRCNRLSFNGGIMIPEAKLGKCKNFQNKRR